MSIPYSAKLNWTQFQTAPNWYLDDIETIKDPVTIEGQGKRAIEDLVDQLFMQLISRGIQSIRDTLRLVLKTPIRCIYKPCIEKCLWRQGERAGINGKMTFYSIVQLLSVPAKFLVALIALGISPLSQRKAKWLQDQSASWTKNIDGRMSKLEAQKEEGLKNAKSEKQFLAYKKWIQKIPTSLALKEIPNKTE